MALMANRRDSHVVYRLGATIITYGRTQLLGLASFFLF